MKKLTQDQIIEQIFSHCDFVTIINAIRDEIAEGVEEIYDDAVNDPESIIDAKEMETAAKLLTIATEIMQRVHDRNAE